MFDHALHHGGGRATSRPKECRPALKLPRVSPPGGMRKVFPSAFTNALSILSSAMDDRPLLFHPGFGLLIRNHDAVLIGHKASSQKHPPPFKLFAIVIAWIGGYEVWKHLGDGQTLPCGLAGNGRGLGLGPGFGFFIRPECPFCCGDRASSQKLSPTFKLCAVIALRPGRHTLRE